MLIYKCDACGETAHKRINQISFPVHITQISGTGYVDSQWNDISGRFEEYDLCQKCYNRIYRVAWNELNTIITENTSIEK